MSLIIPNNDIINLYTETLTKNKFIDQVSIRSIHRDIDICFNSLQREILYAIQECFTKDNNNKINSQFKECLLGKALIISKDKIPKKPPFDKLKRYYKLKFFERISMIERYFDLNKINYDDLKIQKKKIMVSYSSIIYIKKIPFAIIKYILNFLQYDFYSYEKLRNEYEKKRKKKYKYII